MAKGQARSNREVRKPKKKKEPVVAPVLMKGTLATSAPTKKK